MTATGVPAPGVPATGAIGLRAPRKEDPRLLRGRGRFGADFSARGQLWARVVRSPVAHGRLRAVDVSRARQAAGVAPRSQRLTCPAARAGRGSQSGWPCRTST